MLILESLRFACDTCIRGHRSSNCAHRDRDLLELRKKGRPRHAACDQCRRLSSKKRPSGDCPHVSQATAQSPAEADPAEKPTVTLPSGQKLTLISQQSAQTVRDLLARGVQFVITTGAGAGNSAAKSSKPAKCTVTPPTASTASSASTSTSVSTLPSAGSPTSPQSPTPPQTLDPRLTTTTAAAPFQPRVEAVISLSTLLNPCNCQERTGRRCLCCDISDDADPVPCDSADCSCAHSVLGSLHLLPSQVSKAPASVGGSCCGGGRGVAVPPTSSPPGCAPKPAATSSCCAPPPPPPPVKRSPCCAPKSPSPSSCCPPQQQQAASAASCCGKDNNKALSSTSLDMLIAAAKFTPSAPSAAPTWTSLPLSATTTVTQTSSPPSATFDFPFLFPTLSAGAPAKSTLSPPPPAVHSLLFSPTTLAPIQSVPPAISTTPSVGDASCIPLPTKATPGPQCAPLHPVGATNTLPSCCQPTSSSSGPSCCGAGGPGSSTCTCCLPPASPPPTTNPRQASSCCCSLASGCTAGPTGCECTGASACGGECCARAKSRKRDRDDGTSHGQEQGGMGKGNDGDGQRVRKVQVNAQRKAMCTCGCVRPAVECGDCSRDLCLDYLLKDL